MRRRLRSRLVLRDALALALSFSLTLCAAPAQPAKAATRNAQISYRAIAFSASKKLCVGDKLEIDVAIHRTAVINGTAYSAWVTGGLLEAVIKNRQVGRFDPPRDPMQAQIDASVANFVTFTFVATAPGETEIDFNIKRSGEEARGIPIRPAPGGVPAASFFTTIEVTDCYDAYTSGLGTTFTMKDMGDLTKPFFLEGRIATSTVAGSTQFMFFIPNPQNRTTGGYAFVDTAWATADPRARCTLFVSGRYDVVLYGDPARPVEGDLLMTGTGSAVCRGSTTPIDYANRTGFQIAFKPRPAAP